jgi:hypothetical protein
MSNRSHHSIELVSRCQNHQGRLNDIKPDIKNLSITTHTTSLRLLLSSLFTVRDP